MSEGVRSANLSELLQDIRLLSGDWVRIELASAGAVLMPAGETLAAHLVISGAALLQADDKEPILLEAGQTALLPQGRGHVLRSTEGGGSAMSTGHFDEVRGFDIPPPLRFGSGTSTGATVLSAQLRFNWPGRIPPPNHLPVVLLGTRSYQRDHTAAQSASLALDQTARNPGASVCLSRYVHLLLVRELSTYLQEHPTLVGAEDSVAASLARAIDAVQTRPEHAWTVERLARYVGMSRSTFAAKFKDAFERGPMDMVTAQRMEIAARYLRDPNARIKTIAAKVGYNSDTAFLRRFQNHFGMSPSTFRQTAIQGAPSKDPIPLAF